MTTVNSQLIFNDISSDYGEFDEETLTANIVIEIKELPSETRVKVMQTVRALYADMVTSVKQIS